jgi:hypothetical protein
MPPKAAPASLLRRAFEAGKVIAKKTKIISTALNHAGLTNLAKHARMAGYGPRRRAPVRRRRRRV